VRGLICALVAGMLLPTAAAAHDLESAVAFYDDEKLEALITSVNTGAESRLFEGEGQATGARLGYTGRFIKFKDPADLLSKQLEGKTRIEEHGMNVSLDQGLAVGSTIGLLAGGSDSPLAISRYAGLRAGQWFRSETLQTQLEFRRTRLSQPSIEFTDTDGKRVTTPEALAGANVAFSATHFTTPTTILRGSVSHTERSDRPPASSVGAEVRQFLNATESAVHVALNHYENVGSIDASQQYGSIVANGARLEWHQRLASRLALMGGYRSYLESEKPRAADAARRRLGSDSIYGSLRWRPGMGGWTDEASELYLVFARYTTNVPSSAWLAGLGGRWVI